MVLLLKNLSCFDQKYVNGSKTKSSQSSIITLVRGHICSFLQVKYVTWLCTSHVWLDWIDHWNFILDYKLVHTWSTHTTHKFNVQWMPISFVSLYMFYCDVCVFNHMWIKPKRFLFFFFCLLLEVICITHVFQIDFVWKSCFLGVFVTYFKCKFNWELNGPILKIFNFG